MAPPAEIDNQNRPQAIANDLRISGFLSVPSNYLSRLLLPPSFEVNVRRMGGRAESSVLGFVEI